MYYLMKNDNEQANVEFDVGVHNGAAPYLSLNPTITVEMEKQNLHTSFRECMNK